jgi:hypothetical protein
MTQAGAGTARDIHSEAAGVLETLRRDVAGGAEWFPALLAAVRGWPLAEERLDDRTYRYLVAGQAFDWLLLAERLTAEIADYVPEDELAALLYDNDLPEGVTEADLQQLMGAKYKAHLNFVYGVRVEAALQMAVHDEVRKEHHSTRIWEKNGHAEDEVHQRIYSRPLAELLAEFAQETGALEGEWVSLAGLSEWRYWLFQQRMKNCDPEKVASDTRKGLAALQRLDAASRRRRHRAADDGPS